MLNVFMNACHFIVHFICCFSVTYDRLIFVEDSWIEENLKALDVAKQMSPKNIEDIDEILGSKPTEESNARILVKNITNPV